MQIRSMEQMTDNCALSLDKVMDNDQIPVCPTGLDMNVLAYQPLWLIVF